MFVWFRGRVEMNKQSYELMFENAGSYSPESKANFE
jgi:hypothetical protein